MIRYIIQYGVMLSVLLLYVTPAVSHCEIPCGIYDDKMRISLLNEHIATIEKSMDQINSPANGISNNQRIRWVMNKEKHATKFQEIVSQYFLTQRIKADAPKYSEMLEALHQMLIYAMKCKQTTDLNNAEKLKELVHSFEQLYFAPH